MSVSVLARQVDCYAAARKGEGPPIRILNNVNLAVPPGTLFAIMGPSGSGKTTLLNILAGRTDPKLMSPFVGELPSWRKGIRPYGKMYLNGNYMTAHEASAYSRYVMQRDCLLPYLTVYETIHFASRLKGGQSLKSQEVKSRTEKVIEALGLSECRDVLIGNHIRKGVSGGQKKRVSIAIELLDDPPLLFLDEPTSGLDSSLAFDVVKILRELSKGGRTVIATIHQPRSQIFQMFDGLCLLSAGEVVYHGAANRASAYMKSIGYPCPATFNAADFLLDLLTSSGAKSELTEELQRRGSRVSREVSKEAMWSPRELSKTVIDQENVIEGRATATSEELSRLPAMFLESPEGRKYMEEVGKMESEVIPVPPGPVRSMRGSVRRYVRSIWHLTARGMKNRARDPATTVVRLVVVLIQGILNGGIFYDAPQPQHEYDCLNFFNFLGAITFPIMALSYGVIGHYIQFIFMRPQLNREVAGRMYHISAFAIAIHLADFLFICLDPLLLTFVIWWLVKYGSGAQDWWFFFLTSLCATMASTGFIFFGASLVAAPMMLGVIAPLGLTIMTLTSGYMITEDALGPFWGLFKYVSHIRYALKALIAYFFGSLGVMETCWGVEESGGAAYNLGLIIALAVIWRCLAYGGLRFTNRRVGMES